MSETSFKNLIVWQKSLDLSIKIYELTKLFPKSEIYGLTSQIQRCAVSIPSNIAEGQQRHSKKEFRQFLGIASGSAGELETQLIIAQRVYGVTIDELLIELSEVQRMLNSLSSKLAK